METARKLRADKFRGFLVFITVLKEMVFQSFEVQTCDYLVKPAQIENELSEKDNIPTGGRMLLYQNKRESGCIGRIWSE